MKYIDLFNFLVSKEGEQLSVVQAIRNIMRIKKIDPSIKQAMETYFATGKCGYTEAGVSFTELVHKEKMKPVRAFLMLDWLKREPITALKYLALRDFHTDLVSSGNAKVSDKVDEVQTEETDI